jgi:hypothetical protein
MRKIRCGVTPKVILVGFGYGESNAIGAAGHSSRLHDAVIRVYDESGNVIETHEDKGEFKESYDSFFSSQATILGFLEDP